MDRLEERQALDRVLDAARGGLSAALVVRGEPGVGKTSLLGYAAGSAAGFRVIRVAGVESELELGFAGLHRLLVSFLPAMAGLPQRQRKALCSAWSTTRNGLTRSPSRSSPWCDDGYTPSESRWYSALAMPPTAACCWRA